MARKDRETGLELQQFLMHVVFVGELQAQQIQDALGMVGSSYYKRVKEAEYPNAEEIDRLVEGLNLVDVGLTAGELKIRFGIVDPANIPAIKRELQDMEEYLRLNHPSTTMTRKEVIRRRGLARYRARPDAPPM